MIRRKFGSAKARSIFHPQAHIHSNTKVSKDGSVYRTSFPMKPEKRALTLCQCPTCFREIPEELKALATHMHLNEGRCLTKQEIRDEDDNCGR